RAAGSAGGAVGAGRWLWARGGEAGAIGDAQVAEHARGTAAGDGGRAIDLEQFATELISPLPVIPAKAGIQGVRQATEHVALDSRFRGNDRRKIRQLLSVRPLDSG